MMNEGLPTDLWLSAHIRIAAQSGVPMTIVHRGDNASGAVLLKINKLDGTASVLTQIRMDDEQVWMPAFPAGFVPEPEADAYLARQTDFDPDLWIVEVEDKQGRPWLPGRLASF